MPKLTKTLVDAIPKPAKGDSFTWDNEVKGFGVRVQASGRKIYMVRYRNADGVQRKMNLARCSDMPPESARKLARDAFASVAAGLDPRQDKRVTKDAPTIADLRARYMAEHAVPPTKKPASIRSDEKNWRVHIEPFFKAAQITKVRDVTRSHVNKLATSLKDSPATANQCIALLSKAFNLAEEWDMRDKNSNPAEGAKKFTISETAIIMKPAQITNLLRALDNMTAECAITPSFAAFIRLLMLTGCRKNEIMHARRSWIDLNTGVLALPDTKTGQRQISLSPAAIDVIHGLTHPGEWLIAGRVHGKPLQTPYKVWAAVKKRAGLPAKMRLHDIRHTAGSLAHMAGATQHEVAQLLGHKQLSTTERYLHGFAGAGAKTANLLGNVMSGDWTPAAAA